MPITINDPMFVINKNMKIYTSPRMIKVVGPPLMLINIRT